MLTKRTLFATFVLTSAAFLPAQSVPRQGLVKPIWITTLPERPGRVYAMGVAAFAPSEAQALKQASQNARIEVLTRLRANVKGETNIRSQAAFTKDSAGNASGTSSQQVSQNSQIRTQASELPGLSVEETWSDVDGRTAYALAYLDVPVAERELRARFDAMKKDLGQETGSPAEPRERMRKLQRLKKAQNELIQLDDMAALLAAGGGSPALRTDVRDQKLAIDRQMDALRATLLFCVKGEKDFGQGIDVVSLIRNAVLKQGLGWSDSNGEFALTLRYSGNRAGINIEKKQYWAHQQEADFIVARGVIEVTLTDAAGTQYESTSIEAKGLGVTDFQADRALVKEFKAKLESTIGHWLETMVN